MELGRRPSWIDREEGGLNEREGDGSVPGMEEQYCNRCSDGGGVVVEGCGEGVRLQVDLGWT